MTDSAAMTSPVPEIDYAKAKRWGDKLRTGRGRTVATIISFGKLLVDAQEDTTHGEWLYALEVAEIHPLDAQRYQRIANSPVLKKTTNLSHLPTAVSSLDFLAGQQTELVEELIEKGLGVPRCDDPGAEAGVLNPDRRRHRTQAVEFTVRSTSSRRQRTSAPSSWCTPRTRLKKSGRGQPLSTRRLRTRVPSSGGLRRPSTSGWSCRITEAVMWLPLDPLAGWFKHLFMERVLVLIPEMKLGGVRVCRLYLGDRPDDFDEKFGILGTVIVQYTRKAPRAKSKRQLGLSMSKAYGSSGLGHPRRRADRGSAAAPLGVWRIRGPGADG